jgi:hypothetical protein
VCVDAIRAIRDYLSAIGFGALLAGLRDGLAGPLVAAALEPAAPALEILFVRLNLLACGSETERWDGRRGDPRGP